MDHINFFLFLSVLVNMLLIKITSIKVSEFGILFSFISVLLYSFPAAIVNVTSNFLLHVSFKLVSIVFLFNILVVVLFENFSFPTLFLVANLIRGFMSTFLFNIVMGILSKETNQGKNLPKLISLSLRIIFGVIIYLLVSNNFLSLFSVVLNAIGFLYFFFLEEEINPIYFNSSDFISANKSILLKSVMIKFGVSVCLSLNKKMILFLLKVFWNVLVFLTKVATFTFALGYTLWSRMSKFSQGTFLFFISLIAKTTLPKQNLVHELSRELMNDVAFETKISIEKYKKIIMKNKEGVKLIEEQKKNFLSTLASIF